MRCAGAAVVSVTPPPAASLPLNPRARTAYSSCFSFASRRHRLALASPASKAPVARAERPTAMAGGEAGAGSSLAGLAVFATLACNVACAVSFLRGRLDARRRRRLPRRCAAAGQDDGDAMDRDAAVELPPDAVLNLEPGDPTMYEAFWRREAAGGRAAATLIRGWEGLSYTSDGSALCWFLEPELEREVRRLHRVVGNAAAAADDDGGGYHLVVGTGATQVYQAAIYALSLSSPESSHPVPVVSPAPYYSSYPPQTDLLESGLYRWAGDASKFTGDECIELVCTPNNPDGATRDAVCPNAKAIHDLVYYWPQYTAIAGAPAEHDIMVFSVSKVTGHAGSRLGWALVRDRDVARNMVYFVDRSTIGVSRDSQVRAARILAVVSDSYEVSAAAGDGGVPRLFEFARRSMEERWRRLRATVDASGGVFSLPEETSGYCHFTKKIVTTCPAFAWLRCDKEGVEDLAELLAGHRIKARGGEQFGGDARCVRINMLDRDGVFDMLVQRLAAIN